MVLKNDCCVYILPYKYILLYSGNNSEKIRQSKVKAYSGSQANDCPDIGCVKPDTTRYFLSINWTPVIRFYNS